MTRLYRYRRNDAIYTAVVRMDATAAAAVIKLTLHVYISSCIVYIACDFFPSFDELCVLLPVRERFMRARAFIMIFHFIRKTWKWREKRVCLSSFWFSTIYREKKSGREQECAREREEGTEQMRQTARKKSGAVACRCMCV